jgi:lysophospholipase L1-like esterase
MEWRMRAAMRRVAYVTFAAMRRFLTWYLPTAAAILAASTFGFGFYEFLRGETGTPVNGQAAAITAKPQTLAISAVVLGDSLARGTGDEAGLGIGGRLSDELKRRQIPNRPVVNLAVNGARTGDLLKVLDSRNVRTIIAESNVVIISIGGNDLWGDTQIRSAAPKNPEAVMDAVLANIEKSVAIVREANPTARIFLIGLYNPFVTTPFGGTLSPLVTRWNARVAERFAGDLNFTVVQTSDLFAHHDRLSADRFHPGGEGYTLIARRIADSL